MTFDMASAPNFNVQSITPIQLTVYKLREDAKLPVRIPPNGFQLFAAEDKILPAQTGTLVRSGIAVKVPDNCYGALAARMDCYPPNGILDWEIEVGNLVIYPDNRDEIKIDLINHTQQPFLIPRHAALCQLLIYPQGNNVAIWEDGTATRGGT